MIGTLRVHSLPNEKDLDLTKFKAQADNELNVNKMTIFLLDRVENTVGKGENAVKTAFSPISTGFSKPYSLEC